MGKNFWRYAQIPGEDDSDESKFSEKLFERSGSTLMLGSLTASMIASMLLFFCLISFDFFRIRFFDLNLMECDFLTIWLAIFTTLM